MMADDASDQKNDVEKYEQIERWCQAQIKRGSEFFFEPKLFRETLRAKSKEWDFPYEVSERSVCVRYGRVRA